MNDRVAFEKPALLSDLYRMAFDKVLDAIIILDTRGTIIEANPAACQQVGCARHKLLYTDIRQIHDSASAENFSSHLERVKATGLANFEAVHIFRDGTRIPVNTQL